MIPLNILNTHLLSFASKLYISKSPAYCPLCLCVSDILFLEFTHLFAFIHLSILMLQEIASYWQREEVLLFVLHTTIFLCHKRFPSYKQRGFDNQILRFTIHLSYTLNTNQFCYIIKIHSSDKSINICQKIYKTI